MFVRRNPVHANAADVFKRRAQRDGAGNVGRARFELEGQDSTNCQMPSDEEKKDLGEYLEKFGNVKLGANIAYRIAVRRKK